MAATETEAAADDWRACIRCCARLEKKTQGAQKNRRKKSAGKTSLNKPRCGPHVVQLFGIVANADAKLLDEKIGGEKNCTEILWCLKRIVKVFSWYVAIQCREITRFQRTFNLLQHIQEERLIKQNLIALVK